MYNTYFSNSINLNHNRLENILTKIKSELNDNNKDLKDNNADSRPQIRKFESTSSYLLKIHPLQEEIQVYDDNSSDFDMKDIQCLDIKFKSLSKEQALRNFGKISKINASDILLRNRDACVICIENYRINESKRILPCGHPFHKKCIDEWLFKQFQDNEPILCPLCQRDLED